MLPSEKKATNIGTVRLGEGCSIAVVWKQRSSNPIFCDL